MRKTVKIVCVTLILLTVIGAVSAQIVTNKARLKVISQESELRWQAMRGPTYERLRAMTSGPMGALNANPDIELMGVYPDGRPWFYGTDNINAARTISTNELWPDGDTGYDLTGSGTALGEMGVWDGGGVRTAHQEFDGRVTQQDNPGALSNHATHVAGTMAAGGVSANAIGMSYEAELAADGIAQSDGLPYVELRSMLGLSRRRGRFNSQFGSRSSSRSRRGKLAPTDARGRCFFHPNSHAHKGRWRIVGLLHGRGRAVAAVSGPG